jgi:hypothetical protein
MTLPIPAVGDLATAAWADQVAGGFQVWTAFTPALSGSTTNPTLGTGSSATGRYIQIGKTVVGAGAFSWGSSPTAGSGQYLITLPLPVLTTVGTQPLGVCRVKCAGLYTDALLSAYFGSQCQLGYPSAAVNGTLVAVGAGAPGTWAVSDRIDFQFRYETT